MFDNFFKKLIPEEPDEIDNLTPINELSQDIKALGKIIFIYLAVDIFITTFITGIIYQVFRNMLFGDTIYLLSSFKYGITKMIILTIILVILFLLIGFKSYRSVKRNYLINYKDNYMKSKRETFGGAHFQEGEELEENFDIYDSVEDTEDNIFGEDKDGKVYVHKSKPGMNKNEIFFGAPGSGKTSSKILSDCMQCLRRGDSMILTDTKGDVYSQTSAIARKMGYKVRVLNLKVSEFKNSDAFNILETLKPDDPTLDAKADMIANIIIKNSSESDREVSDYWAKNEFNLFKCLAMYVATDESMIKNGLNTLPQMFNLLSKLNPDGLSVLFTQFDKGTPIRQCYDIFANCEERNQGQIINGASIRLATCTNTYLQSVLSHNEIDPIEPMKSKCIYYVIISDTDDTYRMYSSLFFSMLFSEQCDYSDKLTKEEKKKQKNVYYLLDEYRATGGIHGLPIKIATVRSRKIGLTMILQDKGQLETMYDESEAATILNCCTIKGLLSTNDLTTAQYFSDLLGTQTVVTQNDRMNESSADIIHAHGIVQKSYSENQRALMLPEELMNGKFSRDEIIYIISSEPPVKLRKCFAELGGEAKHYLLKESYALGEKKPHKHKPKWRKLIEDAEKKKEETLTQDNTQATTPSSEKEEAKPPVFNSPTQIKEDVPTEEAQVTIEQTSPPTPKKKNKYIKISDNKNDKTESDTTINSDVPEQEPIIIGTEDNREFGEAWSDEGMFD